MKQMISLSNVVITLIILHCYTEAQVYQWMGTLTQHDQYDQRPRDVIIPDTSDVIRVQGVIRVWRAHLGNVSPSSRVRLQLWRPILDRMGQSPSGLEETEVPYLARLVGQTDYRSVGAFGPGQHNFTLEHHERLRVEEGDLLGLQYEGGNPLSFQAGVVCASVGGDGRRMDVYSSSDYVVDEEEPYRRFSVIEAARCRSYSMDVQIVVSECREIVTSFKAGNLNGDADITEGWGDGCWVVRSDDVQSAAVIDIQEVGITTSCSSPEDYLEVRKGSTSTAPLLARFCQSFLPTEEQRTVYESHVRGALYIRFVALAGSKAKGFRLLHQSVWRRRLPGVSLNCSMVMVDSFPATLSSPNFPNPYPPKTDLCWVVRTVASSSRLVVEVSDSDLEMWTFDPRTQAAVCHDFIKIYDGDSVTVPMLREWCGKQRPGQLVSSGAELLIWFSSNTLVQGNGFKLQVHAQLQEPLACVRLTATGKEQFIQSRGYPEYYPPLWQACWVVEAPRRVRLTLYDSGLEESNTCAYDYLEVRDGENSSAPLLRRICDQDTGSYIISSGSKLYIHFLSDESVEAPGFRVGFAETHSETCAIYTAYSYLLELKSPGYDNLQYPPDMDICWTVVAPSPRDQVRLEANNFNLQDSPECSEDSVTFYDGANLQSPVLGRWCGNLTDAGVLSTGRNLTIRLITDRSRHARGFRLSYVSQPSHSCSSLYASDVERQLMSVNHPQPYDPNTNSCWIIEATSEYDVIVIEVVTVNIDGPSLPRQHCDKDILSITDGTHNDSNPLMTVCGDDVPNKVLTTAGRYAMITFVTDSESQRNGFQLRYHGKKEDRCTIVTARKVVGTLTSPGYPVMYAPYSFTCWVLRATTVNNTIRMVIDDLDLAPGCQDYIDVREGADLKDARLRHWCGGKRPGGVISSGHVLSVRFVSDGQRLGRGFKLSFWEEEELILPLTTPTTVGTTPTATSTSTGSTRPETDLTSSTPPTSGSTTSPITEMSSTDLSLPTTKMSSILDCVRMITSDVVMTLSSRAYPTDSNGGMERCWVLTSGIEDARLDITMLSFFIPQLYCGANGLQYFEMRDGWSPTSPLMKRLCGSEYPTEPFFTTGHSVYIRFVVQTSESYFNLQYAHHALNRTLTTERPTPPKVKAIATKSSVSPTVLGLSIACAIVFVLIVIMGVMTYFRVCGFTCGVTYTDVTYLDSSIGDIPATIENEPTSSWVHSGGESNSRVAGGSVKTNVNIFSALTSTYGEVDRVSASTVSSDEFFGMPENFKTNRPGIPWMNYSGTENKALVSSKGSVSSSVSDRKQALAALSGSFLRSNASGVSAGGAATLRRPKADTVDASYTPATNERMV